MDIVIYSLIFFALFCLFSFRILGVSFFGNHTKREDDQYASEVKEETVTSVEEQAPSTKEAKKKASKKSSKKQAKKSKKKKKN